MLFINRYRRHEEEKPFNRTISSVDDDCTTGIQRGNFQPLEGQALVPRVVPVSTGYETVFVQIVDACITNAILIIFQEIPITSEILEDIPDDFMYDSPYVKTQVYPITDTGEEISPS